MATWSQQRMSGKRGRLSETENIKMVEKLLSSHFTNLGDTIYIKNSASWLIEIIHVDGWSSVVGYVT